ncbi:hypothetical protein K3495_g12967 [Podosphaera aphanis]|nr:hypothetical protein K3495_g12967 [Podosphaera aphanis]
MIEKVEHLRSSLSIIQDERKVNKSSLQNYDFFRLQCLVNYFEQLLEGRKMIESSETIANAVLGKKRGAGNEWAARSLRHWADFYLVHGRLPLRNREKYVKRQSLLSNEDIQNACLKWLRLTKMKDRKINNFQLHLKDSIIPAIFGIHNHHIPHSTLLKYMRIWGYSYQRDGQDIYYDDHEREDVVAYRKSFSRRMIQYLSFMKTYEHGDEETIIQPQLDFGDIEHVLVTHDETYFYAFDGQTGGWLRDGESNLRKKA